MATFKLTVDLDKCIQISEAQESKLELTAKEWDELYKDDPSDYEYNWQYLNNN